MKLSDLRVQVKDRSVVNKRTATSYRRASAADLVAVLIEEGGEIQDTQYQRPAPWHNWVLLAPAKGAYLVFPISEVPDV